MVSRLGSRPLQESRDQAPEWASEIYQVSSLLVAALLILATPTTRIVPAWYGTVLRGLVLVVAVWRLIDVVLFTFNWTLSSAPIHSPQRSLIAVVLNILEVSIFTSIIKAVSDHTMDISATLADVGAGLATIVTFNIGEPQGQLERVVANVRLAIGAILMLLVASSVVGGIVRRSLDQNDKSAA